MSTHIGDDDLSSVHPAHREDYDVETKANALVSTPESSQEGAKREFDDYDRNLHTGKLLTIAVIFLLHLSGCLDTRSALGFIHVLLPFP